ncbi:MAG: ExeM/NucH family extracellular endonuclease, partial [Comamonadaceae bacterium]
GTVITPLVRADGQATATGHAGAAVGAANSVSAVWDGVSVTEPKYKAAVAGQDGAFTGTAGTGSPGLTEAVETAVGAAPNYAQPFNDATGFADFTKYSQDADAANSWFLNSTAGNDKAAEANGFGDTAAANDWLISKAFNLNGTAVEFLSFRTWTNFTDSGFAQPLTLKYSTDYSGTGDPALATWTELTFTASPRASQTWTDSGLIDLSELSGTNVHFAFQYQSSGTASNSSSSWRVDDFQLQSHATPVISIAATDADKAEGDSGSTAHTFTVTRAGSNLAAETVQWAVTGSGANPADAADFGGTLPAGTVSFEAGQKTATLTVNAVADTAVELDEGFTVTLGQPSAGSTVINGGAAQGTIRNDDGLTITQIGAIQGDVTDVANIAANSAIHGQKVIIEGTLTGYAAGLSGFYVQDAGDGNANTSDGIFVYFGSNVAIKDLVAASTPGYTVRVEGTVGNYKGQTQLSGAITYTVLDDTGTALPAPAQITLPVVDMLAWERVEGMLVEVSSGTGGGPLVVTDNYNYGRYGQATLTSDDLQALFTEGNAPDKTGFDAHNAQLKLDQIILDDGLGAQNPSTGLVGRDGQPLTADNPLRAGDATDKVVGIVDQFFGATNTDANSGSNAHPQAAAHETTYRIQTVTETPVFTGAPRPTADDIPTAIQDAEIKVASANVLNYFNTLGTAQFETSAGNMIAGRGASNEAEFVRQQDKIVDSLLGMDADVIGLMEIQNNGFADGSALDALVKALNAKAGGDIYTYVGAPDNGAGSDAITVAVIYKKDKVAPVGTTASPDDIAAYDAFYTLGNRVPVAQTFESLADGEQFTVVVNHFKSKGSGTAEQGVDQGDGQGASYLAREKAAAQLLEWLGTNPTGQNDSDVLLLGDFNAYSQEKTVTDLVAGGYEKVSSGYSYSFDGLWGSLDHVFASDALNGSGQLAGVYKWGINAEEPVVLDYNTDFPKPSDAYAPDAYRSSDHNPILVGLNLGAPTPTPGLQIVGTAQADVLQGGAGDDRIDGGAGLDWVRSDDARTAHEVTRNA